MCTTKGATATYNFEKINNVITQNQIFVGSSVDKISVNKVKRNSIKRRANNVLAVLNIRHIMQHVKEEIAFLVLLDLMLRI
jgi:RNase P protein component